MASLSVWESREGKVSIQQRERERGREGEREKEQERGSEEEKMETASVNKADYEVERKMYLYVCQKIKESAKTVDIEKE